MIKNLFSINIIDKKDVNISIHEDILELITGIKFEEILQNKYNEITKPIIDETKKIFEQYLETNNIKELCNFTELFILGLNYSEEFLDIEFKINKNTFNIKNENDNLPLIMKQISNSYMDMCRKLAREICESIDLKNTNNIKKIFCINSYIMLSGDINTEISTDIPYELFNKHFISVYADKKEINEYNCNSFRPIFRKLFEELNEYSEYLIEIIGERKKILKMKNPSLFEIKLNTDGNVSIRFFQEFKEILHEKLTSEEVYYFISELYLIINELSEELCYIITIINDYEKIKLD